jgi:hypothetical protein
MIWNYCFPSFYVYYPCWDCCSANDTKLKHFLTRKMISTNSFFFVILLFYYYFFWRYSFFHDEINPTLFYIYFLSFLFFFIIREPYNIIIIFGRTHNEHWKGYNPITKILKNHWDIKIFFCPAWIYIQSTYTKILFNYIILPMFAL